MAYSLAPDHKPLTAGEIAVGTFIEHFGDNLSSGAEKNLIANLDGYDAVAVNRAVADILGKTSHERDKFHVGKFPTIDEILPRCRYHQNEIAKSKRPVAQIVDANRSRVSSNSPFDIKQEAHRYAVRGRAVLDKSITHLQFEKNARSNKFPSGSTYFAITGNVYAPKPEGQGA